MNRLELKKRLGIERQNLRACPILKRRCSREVRVNPTTEVLADGLPSGKFSIRNQPLAVIGATFDNGKTGFYLLANDSGASPKNIVSAEALLDDKCAN
jgi:hypothetical protein